MSVAYMKKIKEQKELQLRSLQNRENLVLLVFFKGNYVQDKTGVGTG